MIALTDAQRVLVEENLGLVNKIAMQWKCRVPPCVEMDDIQQAGRLGLISAAQRYDSSQCAFGTFAAFRIRGAILDYLRSLDTVSKEQRSRIKAGEEFGVADERLDKMTDKSGEMRSQQESPEDAVIALDFSQQLGCLMEGLSERQRGVIQKHYYEGLSMREIAKDLGCTEPNISRMHSIIVEKIRKSQRFRERREVFRFALMAGQFHDGAGR